MELKSYILPLLKWWWLLLLASGLAAVTSFWTVGKQPEQYRSTATLMIGQAIQDPNPSGNQLFLGNQLAEAYADLAQRGPVRQATSAALGLSFLPNYNVRALPNRQLIEIAVIDTDPARAQAVANELANQLIRMSPGGTQEGEQDRNAFIEQQLDKLEQQITATEDEILAKEQLLGDLFSAREIADTESEINALQAKLRTLQSNYAGLLAGTKEDAVNTLTLFEPASFPTQPVGPGRAMAVLTATAIAFALAAAAAYGLEYLDDTVKSPEQVNKQFGIPVVGTIARFQEIDADANHKLIMKNAPRSPEAEGFRGLRTAIRHALSANDANSLLITSPHQADGKSLVAANLALALAQAGQRTLLIDIDLHRSTQHKLFALSNNKGISTLLLQPELLVETEDVGDFLTSLKEDCIIEGTSQERLDLMAAGPLSANPSELLIGGNIRKLLDLLAFEYDVIILDTPPSLAVSDAVALSTQVDAVYILASVKRTRKGDLESTLKHFKSVGANLGGLILNRLSARSEHYYYSYSRYSDYMRSNQQVDDDIDIIQRPSKDNNNGLRERLLGWRPQNGSGTATQNQVGEQR